MTWKQFSSLSNIEKDKLLTSIIGVEFRYSTGRKSIGIMISHILEKGYTLELLLNSRNGSLLKVRNNHVGIQLRHTNINTLIGAAVLFVEGNLIYE